MLAQSEFPIGAPISFTTESGAEYKFQIADLLLERELANTSARLGKTFFDEIAGEDYTKILDLGGRDRSKAGLSLFLDRHDVTVFDIIPDRGVDVVGDAHELSRLVPRDHFDAVHCRSVLEHIAMPWKVAIEVAKVLRIGGVGLFHTHQTVGMHDLPWDFWRFSDSAWDALFNEQTGFRVEHRALAHELFIIPFRWRPGVEFENTAGFESSSVIVRKIGQPKVEWPVSLRQVLTTMYPSS